LLTINKNYHRSAIIRPAPAFPTHTHINEPTRNNYPYTGNACSDNSAYAFEYTHYHTTGYMDTGAHEYTYSSQPYTVAAGYAHTHSYINP